MDRQTVLLLFGGESSEHEVSIASARNVYAAMDDTTFEVVLCFIDTSGKWWLIEELDVDINTQNAPQLVAALGGRGFLTLPGNRLICPDVIFPILHGKNGEDGTVQGLARLMHIPVVGCNVTASALGMDKLATKAVAASYGIATTRHIAYFSGQPLPDFSHVTAELGKVVFVKPSRAGSSVGVSRAGDADSFEAAMQLALKHDNRVLIEQAIDARELEIAILGNPPNHTASGIGEIVAGDEFYSYDAKYGSASDSKVIIPAELEPETKERVTDWALKLYAALDCTGLARVDFFLANNGSLYLNEINTMPGFTNISMYPKLWREAGVSYHALIERLIKDAVVAVVQ